ncbi:hypothetical protein [uncultured Subdoligranulum sp.]|uniref:hypothetical protein n=1 Tax=uncultured Subdoligranulum sp. TaxID=512298 RepID=UPI0025DF132B|nr:hypothetical protein [uncultured Subdoligranulum sp.]
MKLRLGIIGAGNIATSHIQNVLDGKCYFPRWFMNAFTALEMNFVKENSEKVIWLTFCR